MPIITTQQKVHIMDEEVIKTIITVVVMLIPVLILAYSILDKFMF